MPIISQEQAEAETAQPPAPPAPAELQAIQQQRDAEHYEATQHDAAILIWLLIAGLLLAFGIYRLLRHRARRARRAAVSTLHLIDRAAYAVGIDSRKIAARWRERR